MNVSRRQFLSRSTPAIAAGGFLPANAQADPRKGLETVAPACRIRNQGVWHSLMGWGWRSPW